jgi:hypothetical protein
MMGLGHVCDEPGVQTPDSITGSRFEDLVAQFGENWDEEQKNEIEMGNSLLCFSLIDSSRHREGHHIMV